MKTFTLLSTAEEETRTLGEALGGVAQPGDVVTLDGDLGCGKTRFAQGVARGLGIARPVTSPTFALLEVYEDGRLPLYHFDLYRLETEDDLESVDFFATVEGDGLSLVEWANLFEDAMPDDRLRLRFRIVPLGGLGLTADDGRRIGRVIECEATGPRAEALLAAWTAALP